jgi:hypothetical protein
MFLTLQGTMIKTPSAVLPPSGVHEKVGVIKKTVNQKQYSHMK